MIDSSSIDDLITAMDVWHLSIPVVSRRDHGIGSVAGEIDIVIVRLTSSRGLEGFGEASPWPVFTGTAEANFAALDRYLRPHVVGSRLGDWRDTMSVAQLAVVHCQEAKAALETAFLDLAGKTLEQPAWALLGVKCRDKIPLSVSLANPNFEEDLALVERLVEDEIGIVKIKTGFDSHAFDMKRLTELRKRFPNLDIRVDYNQGLSVDEALGRVQDIDSLQPTFIEQPVRAHEYDCMAALREGTRAPLLADESVFGPEDLARATRERICDGVSIKIMKSGGLDRGLAVSSGAAQAGLPAYGGDMFESGIAHLGGTHMIAVAPNISLGCEFYHANYYLHEDVLAQPFPIEHGQVVVPDAPGLGVEVSLEKIERYAVQRKLSGE